jgi:hypothetical protein
MLCIKRLLIRKAISIAAVFSSSSLPGIRNDGMGDLHIIALCQRRHVKAGLKNAQGLRTVRQVIHNVERDSANS